MAKSLRLYEEAQHALVAPSKYIYPSTLKACGDLGDLQQGRVIHDHVLRHELETDVVISSALIDMYCKCRRLEDTHFLFNNLPNRNIITWGSLIAGYVQHGYSSIASDLFARMIQEGIRPNRVILLSVLKACASRRSLREGRLLHDKSVRYGFEADVAIGNTLVVMYSKGGSLAEAERIFWTLTGRNVVSWCAMIAGYMQQGQGFLALELFERMYFDGVRPNSFVFSCILKACGTMEASKQGRITHDQIIRNMLEVDTVIGSSLIDMYAECACLGEAFYVFDRLKGRNIVSWNVMICGYVHHGQYEHALHLFDKMNFEKIKPNKATYLYVMQASGNLGALKDGNTLHGHLFEGGLEVDEVVGSSLIDMYVMCGSLEEACNIFKNLPSQNVISWSAIIRGHTCHGHDLMALELFGGMQEEGLKPDKVTFLCALKAIGILEMEEQGTLMHNLIIVAGLECDVMIGNALMHMYCNCGLVESACRVFDKMSARDAASWSAVITGHAAYGNVPGAFGYFTLMHQEGMKPDRVTVLCILKACGIIKALEQGRLLHDYIRRTEADADVAVGNALIDMYARSGSIEDSLKVFNALARPDTISWGAMISGYAEHGCFDLAWECMQKMERQGLAPNPIMFTSILSACGRAGHVENGHRYFGLMVEYYGIMPSLEHVNCMADLLGHSGCLEEAKRLLQSMPGQPDLMGWMSLLTACRTHGNKKLGQQSFDSISEQDLSYAAGYEFLADIYADVQDNDTAQRLHEVRAMNKAWKRPGKAWLEVMGNVHEFIVGDKTHPLYDKIHSKLENLRDAMQGKGYFPQFDSILAYPTKPNTIPQTTSIKFESCFDEGNLSYLLNPSKSLLKFFATT
ncbi:hypothetical protein GOP47_0015100 [Adiantum capillus-veneris]|uniref:Pentatricopeptide repeat-containing protein n=1 Tax=Adiantum capillus-veneris TaxID=13818 RepID=A0A9D4UN89_ADICA|nr:hypothetical protein GOP47_0015100 [Adiantum capillus-veneris]